MAESCAATSQQYTELNALNAKLLYDGTSQIQHQSLLDNQTDARAWSSLKLRRAENAATIDHFINAGLAIAGQLGATESQQTVSPVRTGTGDAIVGGVGVSAEQIAANVAALSDTVTKLAEAVSAMVAITMSQVQPKPSA